MREVPMFRMILIVAFALVVGSGAVVAVAQSGGTEAQTEAEEAGALVACGTPIASPVASPIPSPVVDEIANAVATAVVPLDASPAAVDACPTPEVGTPAT
jgi:hypothetical protein